MGGKTTSVVVLLPPPLDYTIHLIIYQVHQLCEIIKNVSITFAILFLNQSTFSNLYFTSPMESFLSSSLKYSREGWEKKMVRVKRKQYGRRSFDMLKFDPVSPRRCRRHYLTKKPMVLFQEPIRLRNKKVTAALHTYWSYIPRTSTFFHNIVAPEKNLTS